jgi:Flp pilus assembly pilin Flp
MKTKRKQGQAMVEYIIIVAVVAIAALAIFGLFGDTIKQKMGWTIHQLDDDTNADEYIGEEGDSLDQFREETDVDDF